MVLSFLLHLAQQGRVTWVSMPSAAMKKFICCNSVFTPQSQFGGVHTDFTSQLIFHRFQVNISMRRFEYTELAL